MATSTAGTFTNTPVSFPLSIGRTSSVNVTLSGVVSSAGVTMTSSQRGFELGQTYPNPTQGTSEVEITVPITSAVTMTITDMKGNIVETVLNRHFDAGTYKVTLDATQLTNGTYYYTLTSGSVRLTRELTILK
jgi:hypothetical protein